MNLGDCKWEKQGSNLNLAGSPSTFHTVRLPQGTRICVHRDADQSKDQGVMENDQPVLV